MIQQNHPLVVAIRRLDPVVAEQVSVLLCAADAVVDQARSGIDAHGHEVYCVPVETMDTLSAELARAGGAS